MHSELDADLARGLERQSPPPSSALTDKMHSLVGRGTGRAELDATLDLIDDPLSRALAKGLMRQAPPPSQALRKKIRRITNPTTLRRLAPAGGGRFTAGVHDEVSRRPIWGLVGAAALCVAAGGVCLWMQASDPAQEARSREVDPTEAHSREVDLGQEERSRGVDPAQEARSREVADVELVDPAEIGAVKVEMFSSARDYVALFGATMHNTATERRDLLRGLLERGVTVRVCLADPEGDLFATSAASFGQEASDLFLEAQLTLRGFRNLYDQLEDVERERFEVGLANQVFMNGVYFVDTVNTAPPGAASSFRTATLADSQVLIVPHAWGVDTPELASYRIRGIRSTRYAAAAEQQWRHAKRVDFRALPPWVDNGSPG